MWNKNLYMIALAFLVELANMGKFSGDLQAAISSKKVALRPHTMLVRKNISGFGGTNPLIDSNTQKLAGISTLNGNKLDKGEAVLYDRIALAYAKGAAADGPGKQDYTADAPALLRNSFIEVRQFGKQTLHEPIANYLKGEATTKSDDNFFELPGFQFLVDDESFEINIITPSGAGSLDAADAANNHYFELRANGVITKRE